MVDLKREVGGEGGGRTVNIRRQTCQQVMQHISHVLSLYYFISEQFKLLLKKIC